MDEDEKVYGEDTNIYHDDIMPPLFQLEFFSSYDRSHG